MSERRGRAEAIFQSALVRAIAFALALAMAVLILGWPQAFAPEGEVAYVPLLLVLWGLAAGFTFGVGFVPYHPVPRWLLGPGPAFLLLLGGALWILIRA